MNNPTQGRTVIFVLPDGHHGETRPAIVMESIGGRISLHVFLKPIEEKCGLSSYQPLIDYAPAEMKQPGTWHWPPREATSPSPALVCRATPHVVEADPRHTTLGR